MDLSYCDSEPSLDRLMPFPDTRPAPQRRRLSRVRCSFPTAVRTPWGQVLCTAIDLSLGGAVIEGTEAVRGDRVELTFSIGGESLIVEAECLGPRPASSNAVAFRFLRLSAQALTILSHAVAVGSPV